MISVLKKYKYMFSDLLLNMVGFGIYIVSQQILLLPIVAKLVSDEIYSSIVMYLSILNVVCNTTGVELGNVRLVMDSEYKKNNIMGDFSRILVFLSFIITLILFPILIYLKYSIIGSILLVVTILMANIRLYSTCYYRLEEKYNKVIWQNVCYLIGIIISLILFKFFNNIYFLLFIPELISIIYALKNSDLLQMKLNKTFQFKDTIKKLTELGLVSLLNNIMNYIDKFLVYPILGSFYVAVYYAVNSMSKVTELITNPISSVILSWISNINNENNRDKVINITLIVNIPVIILVTLLTIPMTYIALRILYNQYLSESMILIIPISIIAALGTACTLTKSVLLKFGNTKKLQLIYIIYFVIFMALAYGLSKFKGLIGFAIANLISRTILWIVFVILLISAKKEKMGEKNEIN